jgi:hypothetical protein
MPALSYIKRPKNFYRLIMDFSREEMQLIFSGLYDRFQLRYSNGVIEDTYKPEFDFINNMHIYFINKLHKEPSMYNLKKVKYKNIVEELEKCVTQFNKANIENP